MTQAYRSVFKFHSGSGIWKSLMTFLVPFASGHWNESDSETRYAYLYMFHKNN